jgi:SAM-dependent methyltransferase
LKTKKQLRSEILAIKDWRHPFELENNVFVENNDNFGRTWLHDFQLFKRSIILDILENIIPGLSGKKLEHMSSVDIGCNDGYFTFEAEKTGLKKCVGYELRPESVQRANLIKEFYGKSNIEFRNQNIEEALTSNETFDITLFLGLLYHITSPIDVLSKVSSITENTIIILTFITDEDTSSLQLIREDAQLPGSGAIDLITRPSEKAVVDMLDFVGFNEVARYYPHPFFDFGGKDDVGITKDLWAIYIANKSTEDKHLQAVIPHTRSRYDENLGEPQWVVLKSYDNKINCLNQIDQRFKSKLKRKINSLLK